MGTNHTSTHSVTATRKAVKYEALKIAKAQP